MTEKWWDLKDDLKIYVISFLIVLPIAYFLSL